MLAASPRPTLALDPRPTKSRSPSATPISMTAAQRQPPSPSPSPTIPRKRALEDDEEHKPATSEAVDVPADIPRGAQSRRSRVTCELCSQHISFSDDATGGFTMRHWDAHRARCHGSRSPPEQHATLSSTVPPASASTLAPLLAPITTSSQARTPPMSPPNSAPPHVAAYPDGPPPPKRRRAKRTEDERIAYFRADQFVAQFEPYRVLCGSCNKWIRLRPNSTYCSIPWESHRKSCLAKNGRLNASAPIRAPPTMPAPPPPPPGLTSEDDPDADAEGEDDDEADGQAGSASTPSGSVPPRSATFVPMHMPGDDLSLSAAPRGESRRKNETQRREALLADRLLSAVEPNRVYCSLCQKWVQLRQDSTYCAYPWVQHRAKCIVRNQRRIDKASEHQRGQSARVGSHGWAVQSPTTSRMGGPLGSDGEDELASAQSGTPAPTRPDLDGGAGRASFVARAVVHLFATTYERETDTLPLPALLRYLNAAVPAGKHAPFAEREVVIALMDTGASAGVDLGEYAPAPAPAAHALAPASPVHVPAPASHVRSAPVSPTPPPSHEDKMASLVQASADEARRLEDEDQLMEDDAPVDTADAPMAATDDQA